MRKAQPTDAARLRQVAKWYYEGPLKKRLTNKEIAERLGMEVRNVNKMLEQAEELGIVKIQIPETLLDCGPARDLQRKFDHLKEIITVPWYFQEEYPNLLKRWGVAAAVYFETLADKGDELHVGITGGETLFEFCEAVSTKRRPNVHIYTTALVGRGRLVDTASHIDPLVNAQILWAKCGRINGHIHYATVPPYGDLTRAGIAKELDGLARRQPIREAIEEMDKINVAFAGLGLVKPEPKSEAEANTSKLTMTGLLEPMVTPEQLVAEGAIADFSNSFFDSNGHGDDDKWRFFLTAGHYDPERRGIEFFRRMVEDSKKKVILIAGYLKEDAIKIALQARLFNVWITDNQTLHDTAKDLCD